MVEWYILDDNHNAIVATAGEHMNWRRDNTGDPARVAIDHIGDYVISTIFLGLDHSFNFGPPVLFESMAFKGGSAEVAAERYSTWDEAVEGHKKMVDNYTLKLEKLE